jgi:hypothetical protein
MGIPFGGSAITLLKLRWEMRLLFRISQQGTGQAMPQFHHRVDAKGHTLSWNVDRLIDLAHALPHITVALSSLQEFDEVYWFDATFLPTCRAVVEHAQRIQAVDLTYPIILSADGHVMDGMHRIAKAWMLGQSTITAVQFERDPPPDTVK